MSTLINSTPRADGFRMPGEFEPHVCTWMLWPERPDNWRENAAPAQKIFTEVAHTIRKFEPVRMGVSPQQMLKARSLLSKDIQLEEIAANDSWMRDCGPTFVTDGKAVRAVDWDFNAWGGLYADCELDKLVAATVAQLSGKERYKAPFILEGGSIHSDGQGTLLTTEECLLSSDRNPQKSKQEIEDLLKEYLNLDQVIWLKRGVFNDETKGHVDNLCCFLRPGVVALTWTEDRQDPQYEISCENFEILKSAVDARGRKLEIHKIQQPNPIHITEEESKGVLPVEGTYPREAGDRMAASYINFYFCNGGAVVPTFNDPHDAAALETLQRLLPDRKVVGVYAREIMLGGGNIHCITQQQPV